MKKLMIGFMVISVAGSVSLAQTNFYTNVTNLWYQGGESRSNVLAIANARLATNTNDFAGLLLKAHWHLTFIERAAYSNAFLRLIQVGATITTTNFVHCWQERGRRQNFLDILDHVARNPLTPQQIQVERQKGFINHKPLPASLIEALQDDGYFD